MSAATRSATPRRAAWSLAALVAALLALASAAWADEPMDTSWDGPTLNLSWKGTIYDTYSDTFVGDPVSIPGDESWRTLNIRNTATCTGFVSVEAYNVLAEVPPDTVNEILPEIIELAWDIEGTFDAKTFAEIIDAGGTFHLSTFALGQGDVKPVSIGYRFPIDETRGRNLGFPSTGLSFDVKITIQGDPDSCSELTSTSPPPPSFTPTPTPNETDGTATPTVPKTPHTTAGSGAPHSAGASPGPPGGRPVGPNLAATGAAIVGVLIVAGGLVAIGSATRRRRD